MWVQFNACVKEEYRHARDQLFTSRDGKLINIKNELLGYWKEFLDKSKSDLKILNDLEEELLSRTMKEANVVGTLDSVKNNNKDHK